MTNAVSEELTTKYTSPLTATAAIVARIPLGGTWPRSSYTVPAAAAATVTLPVLNRILDKGLARGVHRDAVGTNGLVHFDALAEVPLEFRRELVDVPRAGVPVPRMRGHEPHHEGAEGACVDRQLLAADLAAVGKLPGNHGINWCRRDKPLEQL